MPRKPRDLTEAGVYHVVTRGNNRQVLFKDDKDFCFFKSLLRLMKEEYRYEIYHYCFMRNHVHLLVRFFDEESFQKVMQRVNLRYAKYYRKKYRYCGHVFQDRFKSFAITKDSYLLECGRYIERNPLKAKIVQDLSDYFWSSYRYYALKNEDPLLTKNPLFITLGNADEERRQQYRDYLFIERPYESLIDKGLVGRGY